jgi:hypothetical protein
VVTAARSSYSSKHSDQRGSESCTIEVVLLTLSSLKPQTFFESVRERSSRPDSTIKPIVAEEPADPHWSQPFEFEPTTGDRPCQTDNRPDKKRSRMSCLYSQCPSVLIRNFGVKIFRRRNGASFAHGIETRSVPGHGIGEIEVLHFVMHREDQ